MSRFPYPTAKEALQSHKKVIASIGEWFQSPRFKGIQRNYSPETVAQYRGSLPLTPLPSSIQAQRLFALLSTRFANGEAVSALGSTDPVQMSQNAHFQEVLYVSGWACSSILTTTNEVGPDFGDYPYDTVPNQVERLFKAQQLHDRKSYYHWLQSSSPETTDRIDYMKPIIADADTGHGGIGSVMKLAKLFAEKGASAIHIEDQLHGGKKCGHLAGKVLVPTGEQVRRLIATRLQWDIMGSENLVIARSDAETGNLLSSSVDPRDHEFIQGVTEPVTPLNQLLVEAQARGARGPELEKVEQKWLSENKLVTFNEAVEQQLVKLGKSDLYESFLVQSKDKANGECREIYEQLTGEQIFFDWDAPRTQEGYYLVSASIDAAVKRVLHYAPYADLLWLETKTPNLEYARSFAKRIHDVYPDKKLVYNLSPSFNWSAHGFTEQDLRQFIKEMGKSGFVLQIVSLAGLHSNAMSSFELARGFSQDGMKAYVDLVQSREKAMGCDVLTHQKWSGAELVDSIVKTVNGTATGSATGGDSTEHSF
jgi:isocitrate lyase